MSKTINVTSVSTSIPSKRPAYKLVPQGIKGITKSEFVAMLAKEMGCSCKDAEKFLDEFWKRLIELLLESKHPKLDFLKGKTK